MKKWIITALLVMVVAVLGGCDQKETNKADSREGSKEQKEEVQMAETITYTNGEKLALWESEKKVPYYDASAGQAVASVIPYIADSNESGECVIICPGGAYEHLSMETEGSEIAAALNEQGISAFILQYRLTPYTNTAIISDVLRAIRYVRYYADSFAIDKEKVTVMGFSAGGHLSLMAAEHYGDEDIETSGDIIDKEDARPDKVVLGYPVVSFADVYTHKSTRTNFLGAGNEGDTALIEKYSGELGVTESTPPMFVWHCKKDKGVTCENSQVLADALTAKGVDCELHLYEGGSHGIGLATRYPGANEWFAACVEWLKKD